MIRFISMTRSPIRVLFGVTLGLYACSFQDFEYLKEGTDAEAGAAGLGQSGTGGSSSGTAGTQSTPGGAGGEDPGHGGDAGAVGAGAPGEGGAPVGGAAGEGGAPATDAGGEGGVPAGVSGEGGAGGEAPPAAGAGGEGPVVPTGTLLNPSFESGLVYWSVDPPTAISVPTRYVYTQFPTSGAGAKDGSYELATWHETDEYTVTVSQTVAGLEPGTYTFAGWFSTTSTRGAHLFARNCGGEEVTVDILPVSFDWFAVAIESFTVSTDSCEVGFTVHGAKVGTNAPDWLNADMFTFTKDP